jgi:Phage integrase, N-terminal SAM-like domain
MVSIHRHVDMKAPRNCRGCAPRGRWTRFASAIGALHQSLRTADAYAHWRRALLRFHHRRHPRDMAEPEVGAFLTRVAADHRLSISSHGQALPVPLHLLPAQLLNGTGIRITAGLQLPASSSSPRPTPCHRFATHLLQACSDSRTVQRLLGQADMATTMTTPTSTSSSGVQCARQSHHCPWFRPEVRQEVTRTTSQAWAGLQPPRRSTRAPAPCRTGGGCDAGSV